MSKQLNISLGISADTSAAKKNLADLFQSLEKISSIQPSFGMKMSEDVQKATKSAQELEYHLSNAMNANTGNLDLSRLQASLASSGQSLKVLMSNLSAAGPIGEQSFLQVARAISSAGTKLTKTQGLLGNFLTTLKNTARWQLSSTMLHGFIGALQGSITYAKELDKSLTNIQIVTQQSDASMASFATKANKAAQALSTTTKAYTDAALIYYQQGLSDSQVEERTNTTIKLANVTGQSAQEVSSQMTAIWNNFSNGADNLERYADVLTKLGATTASSSSEIASGMSKFASVAKTVELSYDKASAAVATVVAETRQSADTVGTAFKTILARVEGLKLGKTLDDGTSLNKYSSALKTVGVDIKDQNDELKSMDTILDDLGSKWSNLSKDQKVATAQTIAGVRQYTQFMALMENYDKVKENEQTAKSAEGTLDEQAEVYANSWEGASKRAKASLESLYNELIPTDFLVKMTNGLADVLSGVTSVVKMFGGLPNILLLVVSILTSRFAPQIASTLDLGINKISVAFNYTKSFFTDSEARINTLKGAMNLFGDIMKNAWGGAANQAQMFANQVNEVVAAGNQIVATDQEIEAGKKRQLSQEEIFNTYIRGRTDEMTKQSMMAMIEESQKENISAGYKSQLESLIQISNLTSLIKQNKKLMTQEQQEQLAKSSDELITLAQAKAEEQERLELIKQEREERLNQASIDNMGNGRVTTDKSQGMSVTTSETDIKANTFSAASSSTKEMQEALTNIAAKSGEIEISFEKAGNSIAMNVMSLNDEVNSEEVMLQLQNSTLANYSLMTEKAAEMKTVQADTYATEEARADKMMEIAAQVENEAILTEEEKNSLQNVIELYDYIKTVQSDAALTEEEKNAKINERVEAINSEFNATTQIQQALNDSEMSDEKRLEAILSITQECGEELAISEQIDEINKDENLSVAQKTQKIAEIVAQRQKELNATRQIANTENKSAAVMKTVPGLINKATGNARKMALYAGNTQKKLDQTAESSRNVVAQQNKASAAASRFDSALNGVKAKLSGIANQKLSLGTGINQAVQGFSQMAMGINAVYNSYKTLTSSDSNFFQKLSASAMMLSMGMSAVTGATKLFGTVTTGVTQIIKAARVQHELSILTTKLKAGADQEEIGAQLTKSKVLTALMGKEKMQLVQEELSNLAQKKKTELTMKDVVSTFLHVGAKDAETGATEGATVAQWLFNAALYACPVVWIVVAILAVIAAIVALIAIMGGFESASDKAAKKAEKAKQEAENLGKAAEEAKEKAEALKAAFDKYDEVVDKLKKCKKGTKEWKEALAEVNSQVMDMIDKYPELMTMQGAVTRNADGMLEISDEARAKVLKNAEEVRIGTQYAAAMAKAEAKEASTDVKSEKLKENMSSSTSFTTTKGTTAYINLEELATSGKISGATDDEFKTNARSAIEEKLEEKGITATNEALDKLVDSLFKHSKEINKITKETEEANAMKYNATSNALAQTDEGKQASQAELFLATQSTQSNIEELKNAIIEDDKKNNSQGTDSSKTSKDIWERYLQAIGKTEDEYVADKNQVRGSDDHREYAYKVDGEEKTVSIDEMAQAIAAYESTQGDAAKDVFEDAKAIYGSLGATGKEFANTAAQGYNAGTGEVDVSAFLEGLSGNKLDVIWENLNGDDHAFTADEGGIVNLGDTSAQAMGFKDAREFEAFTKATGIQADMLYASVQKARELDSDEDYARVNQVVAGGTGKTTEERDAARNRYSAADQKAMAKGYANIKTGGMTEDEADTFLAKMGGDEKSRVEFAKALGNIDVKKKNAAEEVRLLGKKYGLSEEAIEDYAKKLEGLDHTFSSSASSAEETQRKLSAIITSSTKVGDTFSSDKIQELKDAGVNVDNYFTKMKDGTYQLVGNATDLKNVIDQITTDKFKDVALGFTDAKNEVIEHRQHADQTALGNDYTIFTNTDKTKDEQGELGEAEQWERLKYLSKFTDKDWSSVSPELADLIKKIQNEEITDSSQVGADNYSLINKGITELDTDEQTAQTQYLNNATSVADLQSKMNDLMNQEGSTVTYETYANALVSLGSQYENTTAEIEAYQEALKTGNEEQLTAAQEALEAATVIGEAAAKYSLDADTLEVQAELIKSTYEATHEGQTMAQSTAASLAIANQRMNNGVKTLNENWSTWSNTLKTSKKTSKDYAEALSKTRSALADLVGETNEAKIPTTFLQTAEHLEWMGQAAKGDTDAINKLGVALAKAQLEAEEFNSSLYTSAEKNGDDLTETFSQISDLLGKDIHNVNELAKAYQKAQSDISTFMTGYANAVASGTSAASSYLQQNKDSMISALNTMAVSAQWTQEQMEGYMSKMGISANVEVAEVQMPQTTKHQIVHEKWTKEPSEDSTHQNWTKDITTEEYTKTSIGTVSVPQIAVKNSEGEIISDPGEVDVDYVGTSASNSDYGGVSDSSTSSSDDSSSSDSSDDTSSSKETKDYKEYDDEIERYHAITKSIESTTKAIEKLSSAKDKAWGPQKIALIEQEMKANDQYMQKQLKYINEIRSNLREDKAKMDQYGAQYDVNGNIVNYNEIYKRQVDIYNAAVDAYNNSEQTDADKEVFEAAEQAYEDFQTNLERYEEDIEKEADAIKTLDNTIRENYEKLLERNELVLTLRVEVQDNTITFLDHVDKITDHFNTGLNSIVKKMGNINEKSAALLEKNQAYRDGLNQTLETFFSEGYLTTKSGQVLKNDDGSKVSIAQYAREHGVNTKQLMNKIINDEALNDAEEAIISSMTAKDKEALDTAKANIMASSEAIMAEIEKNYGYISSALDEIATEMERAQKPLTRIKDSIDNYANIISILGKDALGVTNGLMREMYNTQANIAHAATEAAQSNVELAETNLNELLAQRSKATQENEIKLLDELIRKQEDALDEAIKTRDQKLQDELKAVTEAYKKTIETFKQEMLDAFAGPNQTWAELKDQWTYVEKSAKRYLPEYKAIYELSKLNRDLNKQIDSTDSIRAKQALRDLQAEINELNKEGVQVSQYDIDNARKRYDLEVARLALEETKDSKNQVRLSKDNEGNWSYIYTANEEDVAKAEQTYEDKLYAMQQANADYINKLQQQIIDAEEKYAEELAKIMTDTELSAEQRTARAKELRRRFSEEMEYLTGESEKAINSNERLYTKDMQWYANYLTCKNALDENSNNLQLAHNTWRLANQDSFITKWNQTFIGTLKGYTTFEDTNKKVNQIASKYTSAMITSYQTMQTKVDTALSTINLSAQTFSSTMNRALSNANAKADSLGTTIANIADSLADNFGAIIDSLSDWRDNYLTIMSDAIQENLYYVQSVNSIIKVENSRYGTNNALVDDTFTWLNPGGGDDYSGNNGSGYSSSYNRSDFSDYSFEYNGYERIYYLHDQEVGRGSAMTTESYIIQDLINNGQWGDNYGAGSWVPIGSRSFDEILADYGFATGGYTGDWSGNDGKLALLHQKELVLNRYDTENVLRSVEFARIIADSINANTQSAQYALADISAKRTYGDIQRKAFDQNVTIKAEFPNATNRNEIEAAFNMLINEASQYANSENF